MLPYRRFNSIGEIFRRCRGGGIFAEFDIVKLRNAAPIAVLTVSV